ncbi:MAG: hypothetical protein ACFFA3_20810 [Promethearchaeota archaeon]
MQIFEVDELPEFPYMEMKEIVDGGLVSEIINEESNGKVFLLVDHDTKSIWTYNTPKSIPKIQVYGAILAQMVRQQLKLFYRTHLLNMFSPGDPEFQELMNKQIGPGRVKIIEEKDFSTPLPSRYVIDTSINSPQIKKAIEYIGQFPQPKNLVRRFLIIGGQIFADEEITEAFVKGEINVVRPVKLGRLNNGFTLFRDQNYSTRLIIKDRKIQGIELFVKEEEKSEPLELKVPVIYEKKFSKPGSVEELIKAFKIPSQLPEEKEEESSSKDDTPN